MRAAIQRVRITSEHAGTLIVEPLAKRSLSNDKNKIFRNTLAIEHTDNYQTCGRYVCTVDTILFHAFFCDCHKSHREMRLLRHEICVAGNVHDVFLTTSTTIQNRSNQSNEKYGTNARR